MVPLIVYLRFASVVLLALLGLGLLANFGCLSSEQHSEHERHNDSIYSHVRDI